MPCILHALMGMRFSVVVGVCSICRCGGGICRIKLLLGRLYGVVVGVGTSIIMCMGTFFGFGVGLVGAAVHRNGGTAQQCHEKELFHWTEN